MLQTTKQKTAILLVLGVLVFALAMLMTPRNIYAASVFDGTWTVVHGGTGQLDLNSDGTYTSTCATFSNYDEATCPDPSGTFAQGYGGSSAYLYFYGDSGKITAYRWAGSTAAPDSIAAGGLTGIIIDRGTEFQCSQFWNNTYQLVQTPLAYADATNTNAFASGSNDLLGKRSADNWVYLAETAPNYFEKGECDTVGDPNPTPEPTPAPTGMLHVADLDGATESVSRWWRATVSIAVVDVEMAPVAGATVNGSWNSGGAASCVTDVNGRCEVNILRSRWSHSVTLTVQDVAHDTLTYDSSANADPDGDSNGTTIMVSR